MKDFGIQLEQFENDWNVLNGDLNWQDFLVIDESDAVRDFEDWE